MSFEPRLLPNGNVLVFARAEAEDGTVGDGSFEVEPDSPEYERYAAELGERDRARLRAGADARPRRTS